MAVITFDNAESGSGGAGAPMFSATGRPLRVVTGQFDFDSSYPTGGEDITGIFDKFASVLGCVFETRGNRVFETDYTNKKVKVFTALNTEAAAASDQSTITDVRFIAWGYSGIGRKA